jgi:hypothetical protein
VPRLGDQFQYLQTHELWGTVSAVLWGPTAIVRVLLLERPDEDGLLAAMRTPNSPWKEIQLT